MHWRRHLLKWLGFVLLGVRLSPASQRASLTASSDRLLLCFAKADEDGLASHANEAALSPQSFKGLFPDNSNLPLRLRGSGPEERRLMVAVGSGLAFAAGGLLASQHYGGLSNLFRRIRNTLKNKPLSWRIFFRSLGTICESEFTDLRAVAEGLNQPVERKHQQRGRGNGIRRFEENEDGEGAGMRRRRTYVRLVKNPDPRLLARIGLSEQDPPPGGIAIKGRSLRQGWGHESLLWEVYADKYFVPSHPFLFHFLTVLRSPETKNVYLFAERACCDVSQYYRAAPAHVNVQLAAAEMVKALSVLHQSGFLHRDVKPHNYLVSLSGHVQLADFEMMWPMGMACRKEEAAETPGFAAPEIQSSLEFVPFTVKTDVYALGMSFARIFLRVRHAQEVPRRGDLVRLILKMISKDVDERPDLEGVMAHAFFRDVDWDKVERQEYGPPFPVAADIMRLADAFVQQAPNGSQTAVTPKSEERHLNAALP